MNENACDNRCLENHIKGSEFYYDMAMVSRINTYHQITRCSLYGHSYKRIYKDISDRHPQSTIWLTGYSLGGAVASIVGQTFLVPIVSFGIPGDQFAARKLHLPHAPGLPLPVWHFGHTADPIFAGKCSVGFLFPTKEQCSQCLTRFFSLECGWWLWGLYCRDTMSYRKSTYEHPFKRHHWMRLC